MLIELFAERRALLTSNGSPSVFIYFQGHRTKAAAEVADVAFEEQMEACQIEAFSFGQKVRWQQRKLGSRVTARTSKTDDAKRRYFYNTGTRPTASRL
jgi:hypothetical protein